MSQRTWGLERGEKRDTAIWGEMREAKRKAGIAGRCTALLAAVPTLHVDVMAQASRV
jgi:hypothetical protein